MKDRNTTAMNTRRGVGGNNYVEKKICYKA